MFEPLVQNPLLARWVNGQGERGYAKLTILCADKGQAN